MSVARAVLDLVRTFDPKAPQAAMSLMRGLVLANGAMVHGIHDSTRRFNPYVVAYNTWKSIVGMESENPENEEKSSLDAFIDGCVPDVFVEAYRAFIDGYRMATNCVLYRGGKLPEEVELLNGNLYENKPPLAPDNASAIDACVYDCIIAMKRAREILMDPKDFDATRHVPLAGLALALRALLNALVHPRRIVNPAKEALANLKSRDWRTWEVDELARVKPILRDLSMEEYGMYRRGLEEARGADGAVLEEAKNLLQFCAHLPMREYTMAQTGVWVGVDTCLGKRNAVEPVEEDKGDEEDGDEDKSSVKKSKTVATAAAAEDDPNLIHYKYYWNGKDMRGESGDWEFVDPKSSHRLQVYIVPRGLGAAADKIVANALGVVRNWCDSIHRNPEDIRAQKV